MSLNLTPLSKAIESAEQLFLLVSDNDKMSRLDFVVQNGLKSGLVRNFEFTYELCWKAMRRWLEINIGRDYIDGITRKELFRMSAENHLINNPVKWFEYNEARNLTSHTYNEAQSDKALVITGEFIAEARNLLDNLRNKND
ncbi:MAG: nucleotidyltransferase substrate binding protein [Firmicutes bacterium]|nr:nucleotidyltransferase substrate binding protein [Bacillota bacterium]